MSKDNGIKRIIEVTTRLIESGNGNTDSITIRQIAEQAGIGVGLINYHFKSKDELIEVCVQRIISNVIYSFQPEMGNELSPLEHLKTVAKQVVDFLTLNPYVSRISILGDFKNPAFKDNTMKTIQGFANSLENSNYSTDEKNMLLFGFTSVLQVAFLRKDISKDCFGVDFNRKVERDRYIDFIAERLFREGKE